jgi:hypothetical protein
MNIFYIFEKQKNTMKPFIVITSFILLLLSSCKNKHEFWNISDFKMDNTALENYEEVKIIYSSGIYPYDEDEEKYYTHLIVISQKTRDTVNILSLANPLVEIDKRDKVFNFFNQDHELSKIVQLDIENIRDLNNISEIKNIQSKKIDKVMRNREFDNITDNNYPTIIGSIGNVTQSNK